MLNLSLVLAPEPLSSPEGKRQAKTLNIRGLGERTSLTTSRGRWVTIVAGNWGWWQGSESGEGCGLLAGSCRLFFHRVLICELISGSSSFFSPLISFSHRIFCEDTQNKALSYGNLDHTLPCRSAFRGECRVEVVVEPDGPSKLVRMYNTKPFSIIPSPPRARVR